MGRVVVVNFTSIDGVVQSPLSPEEDPSGGFAHGGWVPPYADEAVDDVMRTATVGASALLLGRRSYDVLAAAWDGADESEPAVAAMARMPKHVVSRALTDDDLAWSGAQVVDGSPAALAALVDRSDGDLLVLGSGQLVQHLAAHDLVDEYRLLVFPLVLGSGRRMFGDGGALVRFELASCEATDRGVVVVSWRRAAG